MDRSIKLPNREDLKLREGIRSVSAFTNYCLREQLKRIAAIPRDGTSRVTGLVMISVGILATVLACINRKRFDRSEALEKIEGDVGPDRSGDPPEAPDETGPTIHGRGLD